jgi:hypothetical protein
MYGWEGKVFSWREPEVRWTGVAGVCLEGILGYGTAGGRTGPYVRERGADDAAVNEKRESVKLRAETATWEHDHTDSPSLVGTHGSCPIDAATGELQVVSFCMRADHWKTSFWVPRFETAASLPPVKL